MQRSGTIHLLAVAGAVATLLLLSVGGVVTSRDAGMVFEDWPLSNGSVNPEGWLSNPDQRAEHGHRILGAIVGILTVSLAIALHRREPRKFVRVLGWTALVAVCLQGLLGGLRVTEISGALALVHGCFGQAFFALMVALAYLTSRDATETPEPGEGVQRLTVCALSVLVTIYLQVVLGAQLRHQQGPVNAHVLGALLAAGTVLWLVTVTLLRHGDRAPLRRPVLLLTALTAVQIGLGLATRSALSGPVREQGYTLTEVVLPTLHQTTGGLMLALSVVIALRALRRSSPAVAAEAVA
ncbi:MAG: COX15/CtaA family protein [Planctomycetota bacterium]